MPAGPSTLHRIAIVGASSLLGKELKQALEDRNFPASEIILLDESVAAAGTLTEAGGEPAFIRTLEEDSFEGARFVFFAGSVADATRNWPAAQRSGATVIDLTGAVNSYARATTRIPTLNALLGSPAKPAAGNGEPPTHVYVSPPVPVLVATTMAAALHQFVPQRTVVFLLAPVSERDQAGIEELESQTTNLLSFREISKTVFDTQVAFNLLAAYGSDCKPSLEDIRAEVARETSRFLAGRAGVPAIQLLQAPVFYGYTFAAYADLAQPVPAELLAAAFAKAGVTVGGADDPPPSNVTVAGESEIQLARIESDLNLPNGVWLWGAADNLRLAATNAVRIAEELLAEQ